MRYAAALCVLFVAGFSGAQESAPASRPKVLFFSHSAGFRHEVVTRPAPDRLSPAEEAFVGAAGLRGYDAVAKQDCGALAPEKLKDYAAVAFYTTGELPLPPEHRDAFVAWVRAGGAFVGVHPATDTYYKFPEWGEMVGGRFDGHPWHQNVGVLVEQPAHPAAKHLGRRFEIVDEIYQFRDWRAEPARVVLRLDPSSVEIAKGNRKDGDYALAWCRPYGFGRVFYTALGHRPEVWADRRFVDHLFGGLDWAVGRAAWTPERPPRAEAFVEGFEATRPFSFHGEFEASHPDAGDAAVAFGPRTVVSPRYPLTPDERARLSTSGRAVFVAVDVRYEPPGPASDSAPSGLPRDGRTTVWVAGVERPNAALTPHLRGDEPGGLRLLRPDLWRNVYLMPR